MGSTYVSPETMGNYVSRNSEIAYQNSNTEGDFINYFKRKADKNGIDLTYVENKNTLDELLEPYIKIFLKKKRKENYRRTIRIYKKIESSIGRSRSRNKKKRRKYKKIHPRVKRTS